MLEKIIVALDVDSDTAAYRIVDTLGDLITWYKIGSVLFTRYGPSLIHTLKQRQKNVFLDLKFHDIPNTVVGAVRAAVACDVDMLTLHTLGGFTMLKEAVCAAQHAAALEGKKPPILLGVTVLTSMKERDLAEIGINRTVKNQVKKCAVMARNAGINGYVCSANEIKTIKKYCGKECTVVVPGIRPASSAVGDQKRVATPHEALKLGADYLVIGRPIIAAENPRAVVELLSSSH